MIDDHVRVIPIESEEFYAKVMEACHNDDDDLFDATHAVMKGQEIVGAFALMVPMVNWWMRKDSSSRESFTVSRCMETLLANEGIDSFVMPCNEESPYYKNMERIGYQPLPSNMKFFTRNIKGGL
jgi:hypothetical protein|tara:strand:- start:29 stop:403 length:375 start_codon:yes stop_codon:yes gene_type:complete